MLGLSLVLRTNSDFPWTSLTDMFVTEIRWVFYVVGIRFLSTWDGLGYFERQNVEEWLELRGNRVLSRSSVSGNVSRLTWRVWDMARPDNASIVTTHRDVPETSTGVHLPAGARWGYADGNPSPEAPLFLLLHRQLSYLTAVNRLWGCRILDGWRSVIYFVALYTLSTNQPTLVTWFCERF